MATLGLSKLSARFFYHRIFCVIGHDHVLRLVIYTTVGIVVVWIITFELLSGLQCESHFSTLWTSKTDYVKYCMHISYPYLLGYTISDFLLDLWIIILPILRVIPFSLMGVTKAD